MFDAAVCERAVELLREHLSPEQLDQFDTKRTGIDPRPENQHRDWRWFNATGTLGGVYTIGGCLVDEGSQAFVGLGRDVFARHYCVYAWGPGGMPTSRVEPVEGQPGHYMLYYVPMLMAAEKTPVADQMLAYKLTIETEEERFLVLAVPTHSRASAWQQQHRARLNGLDQKTALI